jgi:hypothetical protein
MDHQHTLQLNGSEAHSFMCSSCKELGFESSYICENRNCDYIVHKECSELILQAVHPFFENCNFELYEKVEEVGFCDACGKDMLGFFYACSKTGYALHPCCLNLQHSISHEDGNQIMTLCHEVPSNCFKCNQRQVVRDQFEGWSYVFDSDSSDGKSCIHVSCHKNMIFESLNNNGLNNNGETTTTTSSSKRRRMRSFMKATGKVAVKIVIGTIVKAALSQ